MSKLPELYEEATGRYKALVSGSAVEDLDTADLMHRESREWFKIRVSIAAALSRGERVQGGKGASRGKGVEADPLDDFPVVGE